MGPAAITLGAKLLGIGKRYWPYIAAVMAAGVIFWIVSDRISDAENRALSSERRAATAEATAAQWQEASKVQSESILKLADSYEELSTAMDARDERFRVVWQNTLEATNKLEDRARRLLTIPAAVTPAEACEAATRALRSTAGYGYVLTIDLPASPSKDLTNAKK